MSRRCVALGALLLFVGCAAELPDTVSDTGYEGTWQRGSDFVKSTFAIVEVQGEHRLRWDKRSADGKAVVTCDWDGRCEEFVDGEKTSDYLFRTWIDEDSGRLRVACKGEV